MKTSNILKAFSTLLLSLFILSSCEADGDTIYLSSPVESDFIASTDKAVLTQEIAQKIALSFSWTKSAIFISDPGLTVQDDILLIFIQASTTEDFSSNIVETEEAGLSRAYTAGELNTLAKSLGLTPEVPQNVYFRLRATTGRNLDGAYSKTTIVNVTSYLIDMTIGYILDENKAETNMTLYSSDENGVYTGFMGAFSWQNFYLQEGDGTLWGTDNAGDDNPYTFVLTTESHQWNNWFPGSTGCYYVIMDTPNKNWSALYLPTLEITGDINGEMTFDQENTRWLYNYNATAATTLNIKLSTTGNQYNVSTGMDQPIDTPVAFSQNGDGLLLSSTAGDIAVSFPAAGEYTIIVDLSDPTHWTCIAESGTIEGETPLECLYLPGVDHLTSGDWTFDNYITLYDQSRQAYAGIIDVNSQWGYTFNTEKYNWGNKYTCESGDAYEGTLTFTENDNEGSNIPAPIAGLYLIDVSINDLEYSLAAIGNRIYLEGLNNVWDTFGITLPVTSTPGIFSGEITITEPAASGFQILLKANDWTHVYGGEGGNLLYRNSNFIKDDKEVGIGTYTMTVDLINGTYNIE